MSLFRRSIEPADAAVEAPGGLPDGFDDPGSDFFVPEPLRQYWPADPGFALDAMLDERLVHYAREDIASDRYLELDATDEAGRTAQIPRYWGDMRSGWRHDVPFGSRLVFLQRLDAIGEELLPKPNQPHLVPPLQRVRWIHRLAREAATQQLQAIQQGEQAEAARAAAAARWEGEHTCQLCGLIAESVESVTITAEGHCALVDPDCRALLVQRRLARVATRQVNGRTLAEIADAWLDDPPASPGRKDRTVGEVLAERDAEQRRRQSIDPAAATFGMLRAFGNGRA
jgi:hypothetical protein